LVDVDTGGALVWFGGRARLDEVSMLQKAKRAPGKGYLEELGRRG